MSALVAVGADGLDRDGGDDGRTVVRRNFETATHLLGNGLVGLLGHPDQLHRWRSAPDVLAEPAVDELLRFDSPVRSPAGRRCAR